MAKKITLNDVAGMLAKQAETLKNHGKEIGDLAGSIGHILKHMATKEDIADLRRELKGDIARVQDQVNSMEQQLKYGRYEKRLGDLEEEVFGEARS